MTDCDHDASKTRSGPTRAVEQDITPESLFVLLIFFNPTDNFDVGVDGWVFMLAGFGEASCSLLLANLATSSGNAIWWKKGDLNHDGGNM
jgi:hypothetical protein